MTSNLTTASPLCLEETADSVICPNSNLKNRQPIRSTNKLTISKHEKYVAVPYKWRIVWINVIAFTYLHFGMFYGFYLAIFSGKLATTLWTLLAGVCSGIGITGRAHRLWCHRSYKAKWPLRLILVCFQSMSFQGPVYDWVQNHRTHHKFTDTDADPYNSKRGFFFSHIGWVMLRKHQDVIIKGKTIDMSDVEEDFIVMWQKRTNLVTMPFFCFFLPAWVAVHFWNEDFWNAWYMASITRLVVTLHFTFLVNSAAHMWGTKPFDSNISAVENVSVAIIALGEGWHNYHHVFPWDYKATELGAYSQNITTAFIDFFAKIGWAYDLKTVSEELIQRRIKRTGDGTHTNCTTAGGEQVEDKEMLIWGWGDKDMSVEDIRQAIIANRKD